MESVLLIIRLPYQNYSMSDGKSQTKYDAKHQGECDSGGKRANPEYPYTFDFDGIASTESGAFFPLSVIFEHIPLKNLSSGNPPP